MKTPTPNRRKRKREKTASHLSATAFRLFEANGYETVTMEQIAQEADVAKATLYNYFPVKEALIAHRFHEEISEGMALRASTLSAYGDFESRMRYLLNESAVWHSERRVYLPHYLRFLTSCANETQDKTRNESVDNPGQHILTAMFQAAQQSGEVTTRHSAEEMAKNFEYLLWAAVTAWLHDPSTSLSVRFQRALDLILNGVKQKP